MVTRDLDPFRNPSHNPFGWVNLHADQHPAKYIYGRAQGDDYLDLLKSNHEAVFSRDQRLTNFDPFDNHSAEGFVALNLACGWHPWGFDFAHLNPEVDVICADMDRRPLAFARGDAKARRLDNCEDFHEIDVTAQLPYPDKSFHLVVLEDPSSFLERADEDKLWEEAKRILIPGGNFLVKESSWVTTSSQLSTFQSLQKTALAADQRSVDLLTRAPGLMRQVGLTEVSAEDLMVQILPKIPDSGYSHFWRLMYYHFQTIKPFLIRSGLIDEGGLEQLWLAADFEISQQDHFKAAWFEHYLWACEDLTI